MYRVMIVDDDKPFCDSLQAFNWSAYDCTCVYAAYNGEEALLKCTEMKPHIVITDVNMPVMEGISLLRKLHERCPEICVILLTVHKDFECAYEAVN